MEISLKYPADKTERLAVSPLPKPVVESKGMEELDSLIGLNDIKEAVREIVALMLVQRERSLHNLKNEPCSLHMILSGNPGTGKTTVARIFGRILREHNFLSKGHLVEVERADLVGEYVGHTAQKTREQIKRALGGILFIDEAYTLAQGGSRDFGQESIATLVRGMEEHRNDLVVILAGYPDNMKQFLYSNPGLTSRFPLQLYFPDFSGDELFAIALKMFTDREYELTSRARWVLKGMLTGQVAAGQKGNARYVRNLVEKAIRIQAMRLYCSGRRPNREELKVIEECDLPRWYNTACHYDDGNYHAKGSGVRNGENRAVRTYIEGSF